MGGPLICGLQVFKNDRALTPGLNLQLEQGKVYCLVSESGKGKSLLMQALAGILPPGLHSRGSVAPELIAGRNVVYVFQDASAAMNAVLRVDALLYETWQHRHGHADKEQMKREVVSWLIKLQLDPAILEKQVFELSGGQKQRVNVLLGLLCEPELLLLDEVTSALDAENAANLLNIIMAYSREKKCTVLLAGHDIELLRTFDINFIELSEKEDNKSFIFDKTKKNELNTIEAEPSLLISVQKADFSYNPWQQVLKGVSLELRANEYICITGESGGGKSTLGALLSAQLNVTRGTIQYPVLDPFLWREQLPAFLQVIFQDGFSTLPPFMPVWRILTEGAYYLGRVKASGRRQLAREWLQRLGMPEHLELRRAHELSGGQRQRIGVARALACEPRVLICDEITANLDAHSALTVLNSIDVQKQKSGMAVLYFTHQPSAFPFSFNAAYHLSGGILQKIS